MSRRKFGVLAASGLAAVLLDACTKSGKSASPASSAGSQGQLTSSSAVASTTAPPPISPAVLALDPTNGAAAVSPAHPVTVTAGGGTIDGVTLLSSSGASVPGVLSADKTTWTASQPLGYQRSYTLTAKAVNSAGVPATSTAAFNTLKPDNMTQPALNTRGGGSLTNGGTYGVGMVVRVHFDEQIKDKVAAEQALIVTTTPAVEGSWFWLDSQNVLWRPQNYYTPGTVVSVTAKVYGVEVGPGLYGQSDVTASFTIGQKQVSIADDTTHQVSVYFNDVLQRTMPTSMGKGGYATGSSGQQISFFTPSGIYTVLDKSNPVLMSSASYGLPVNGPGGYSELINWATRISTDGIYLHQLNSTVWAQGSRDLSHGCLNLNFDNATWFYNTSQVGDPVEVQHTGGAPLALWQNGDWSLPWAQWKAGSALNG